MSRREPTSPSTRGSTRRWPDAMYFRNWPIKPDKRPGFGKGDYSEPSWVKETWRSLRKE